VRVLRWVQRATQLRATVSVGDDELVPWTWAQIAAPHPISGEHQPLHPESVNA
jgi:hypothetical protein